MSTQNKKRREFLVILYLGNDKGAKSAVSKLGLRTESDLVSFAAIDCTDNVGNWVDPNATVFDSGSAHDVQLIDWLAK